MRHGGDRLKRVHVCRFEAPRGAVLAKHASMAEAGRDGCGRRGEGHAREQEEQGSGRDVVACLQQRAVGGARHRGEGGVREPDAVGGGDGAGGEGGDGALQLGAEV